MCGIVGIVTAAEAPPPDVVAVEQATRALVHRGPDGTGIHSTSIAAFGSTRLSIIDLKGGSQPLWNEGGTVMTIFNGEIWNYRALKGELEDAGHRFRTHADTEVLVHGYEEWGEELVARLDGMFAFAIWDEARERVLLARDRIGKKPLFIARTPGGLAFGSDMRSVVIAGKLRPNVDREKVAEFLFQRYVVAPRTLLEGIEKVPPGHLLTYDRREARLRPYWSLVPGDTEPVDAGALRQLLRDAVERRLMSDVPLGVLLSGGVDSTAILGLMREAGADSLASFTIGFADATYDERRWARLAAARFETDHHEITVDPGSFVAALPRLAWYRDEPIAEPSEIPLLLLSELAGRHVKVVLTGDGGDELFGGYPKYRAERLLRAGGAAAAATLRLIFSAAARRESHRRFGRAAASLELRDELVRWASWFRTFTPAELRELLNADLRAHASDTGLTEPLRSLLAPHAHLDPGRRMLLGDLVTYLPDNMLTRSDKVLMGASVEGRMPLLDRAVVEAVARIPIGGRAGIRTPKAALRRAVQDLLPDEIARRAKRGFPVPVAELLLASNGGMVERLLLSDRTLERGLVDPSALRALVAAANMARSERDLKLFTLTSLELWLRANVDAVLLEPPETLEELAGDRSLREVSAA